MLRELERKPSPVDAILRIYANRCVFNANACALLGVTPGEGWVRFCIDRDQQLAGRTRVYVGRAEPHAGHLVLGAPRRRTGVINSASTARKLAYALSGYGTYRICEEVTLREEGKTYYEIFFRKFD